MSINDEQYQHWLRTAAPAEKCLLVALSHSQGVLYLGSHAYISRPTDSLANMPFQDRLTELPELIDVVDASAEIGDLEFSWPGSINNLMSIYWRGHKYRLWLGDRSWPFDDFRVIASGYIEGVERTARDRMRVNFSGAGMALETSIATERVNVIEVDVETIPASNPTRTTSTTSAGGYSGATVSPRVSSTTMSTRQVWLGPGMTAPEPDNEPWPGASQGDPFW